MSSNSGLTRCFTCDLDSEWLKLLKPFFLDCTRQSQFKNGSGFQVNPVILLLWLVDKVRFPRIIFRPCIIQVLIWLCFSRSVTLDDDIPTCDNSFKIISSYPSGYVAILHLVSESEVDGWSAEITMDHEFNELTVNESELERKYNWCEL